MTHVVRGLKKNKYRGKVLADRDLSEIQSEKLFLSENPAVERFDSRSVGVNCNRGPLGGDNHFRVVFSSLIKTQNRLQSSDENPR